MRALLTFLLLLFATSAVAQESVGGTWVTTVGPSLNASPTPGSAGSGNVLAITSGGQISLNGSVPAAYSSTANVIALYYINHTAYQENSALNWFGPLTATSSGSQVANPVTSISNFEPDLSAASASPVTGFSSAKIAYSINLYPNNVKQQTPDTTGASAAPIWNIYFGALAAAHPVVNLETGCSCDNSNSQLTDDQNFMNLWVAYANGTAAGSAFTTTGSQQPISNDWYSWGSFAENPNGTLTGTGTIKPGQQTYWQQLLFASTAPLPPSATTWNPGDMAGVTLSTNNSVATGAASGLSGVRSTTSKTTGKFCWAVTASTITPDFGVGIANLVWNIATTGLSGDANGLALYAANTSIGQPIFYNSTLLSSGAAAASTSGSEIDECQDFGGNLGWFTDAAMRTAFGANAWNNSATCNPTVASCGLSTSGLTCPCFIAYSNREAGVAMLNTQGPFAVALPTGFQTFDQPVVSTGRPMIVIMGQNGEQYFASLH